MYCSELLDLKLKNIFSWLLWQIIFTLRIQPELMLSQLGCHEREARLRSFILSLDDSKYSKKRNPAQETIFYSLIALRVKLCGPQSFNSKVPTGTLVYNLAFMHPLFDLLVAYYPVNQSIIYVFILFIN